MLKGITFKTIWSDHENKYASFCRSHYNTRGVLGLGDTKKDARLNALVMHKAVLTYAKMNNFPYGQAYTTLLDKKIRYPRKITNKSIYFS